LIDHSRLELVPGTRADEAFGYDVKKAAEGAYISEFWGWDEDAQVKWHRRDWEEQRPLLIVHNESPIGTISILAGEDDIRVAHFFIAPAYQNQGVGTFLLEQVLADADGARKVVRLSVLENNPARGLYERHGFCVVDSSDHFLHMERKPLPD
jgi:ribosomal protein S18 acetylase RimI-like enzyme